MAEPGNMGCGNGVWGVSGKVFQLSPMLLSLAFLTWVDQSPISFLGRSQILVSLLSVFADKN